MNANSPKLPENFIMNVEKRYYVKMNKSMTHNEDLDLLTLTLSNTTE